MLALGALAVVATSGAIERFRTVRMPDLGYGGSKISGSFMDYTDDSCMFVGSVSNAQGKPVPYAWDLDNDGAFGVVEEIPIPSGWEGEAVGGCMFPNGDIAVVGNIRMNQASVAVLWRKHLFGQHQMTVLSNLNSRISDADYGGPSDPQLLIVGAVQAGGVLRPVLLGLRVTDDNPVAMILPYIEQDAFANGVAFGRNGRHVVVGWATFPSGLRKPCKWEGPTFDSFVPIGIPGNVQGEALDVDLFGNTGSITGRLMRNGRVRGFQAPSYEIEDVSQFFAPLEGSQNSATIGCYNLGDTATHEVGHWMGLSSVPGGTAIATLWLNDTPINARMLLADPAGIVTYEWDFDYNGSAFVSYGEVHNDGEIYAAAFLPTGDLMPDWASVMMGHFFGDTDPSHAAVSLWHDDGREMRVRTENVGGARVAEVETAIPAIVNAHTSPFDLSVFGVTARAASNQPGASGKLMVHLFNYQTNQFDVLAVLDLGDTATHFDLPISGDASRYWDPVHHRVEACLEFTQNGNKLTALCIDSVTAR